MFSIVFDYGHVLGIPNHMKACESLSKYSSLTARELYDQIFLSELEVNHEIGLVDRDQFWTSVKSLFTNELSDEMFFQYWGDINTPNTKIESILKKIKPAVEKFILSNTEDIHWHYISNLEIIRKYFNKNNFILSFQLNDRKPNKSFYLKCLEKVKKPAKLIIYIDDIPDFVSAFCDLGVFGIKYNCEIDDVGHLEKQLSHFGVLE